MGSGGADGRYEGLEPAENVAVTAAVVPVGIPEVMDARGGMPSTAAVTVLVAPVEVVPTAATEVEVEDEDEEETASTAAD